MLGKRCLRVAFYDVMKIMRVQCFRVGKTRRGSSPVETSVGA